jgi:hypothetical protein
MKTTTKRKSEKVREKNLHLNLKQRDNDEPNPNPTSNPNPNPHQLFSPGDRGTSPPPNLATKTRDKDNRRDPPKMPGLRAF